MEVIDTIDSSRLPHSLFEKIPYTFVRKNLILPIEDCGEYLLVVLSDPLNLTAIDELKLMLDRKIKAVLSTDEALLGAINIAYHHKEGATKKLISKLTDEAKEKRFTEEAVETYDLLDVKEEAPIVQLLNLILSEAISQRASDIHFEPFEDDLRIRYRIDGVLQIRHAPNREYQSQLLSRIKVLAKMDIAEHRLPQDGRIKLSMGGKEIDLRVSTVPSSHGERIVLRILDKENLQLGLSQIGMLDSMLADFRKLLSFSEGILLVTGPTGSGKTTTLYSALSEVASDEINIMTVEDPIEYKLKGIAQIAIHPKIGLTFAAGLRHILRQDPDVVMIGEIRDRETAEIAIQAALTGHLVLSTLHTNDAPSAITRLVDMGVEPYLLSSTVIGVIAQRLVRRICPHCKTSLVPSLVEMKELGIKEGDKDSFRLYQGKGCSHCFSSGYFGRTGIYELMLVDEILQQEIAKNCDASFLRHLAIKRGLSSLYHHGIHLVKEGTTTLSEVLRVTRKHYMSEDEPNAAL